MFICTQNRVKIPATHQLIIQRSALNGFNEVCFRAKLKKPSLKIHWRLLFFMKKANPSVEKVSEGWCERVCRGGNLLLLLQESLVT